MMNPEWPYSRSGAATGRTHCPTTPDRKPAKGKKPATVEPLNINSHPQIKEYFQKTWRINLPDTKEETLVELARTTGKPEAASLPITSQSAGTCTSGSIPTSITCRRNIGGVMVECMDSSIHWVQSVVESLPATPTSRTSPAQQSSAVFTSRQKAKSS